MLPLSLVSPSLAAAQTAAASPAATPGSILDDPWLTEQADRALDYLYRYDLAAADSVFAIIGARYEAHPVSPFLEGLSLWWRILPGLTVNDTSYDRAFLDAMDRTEARARELARRADRGAAADAAGRDGSRFDARFFSAAAHGFRGRLYSDRGSWWKASRSGRRAIGDLFELAAWDTTNADLVFGDGVYLYFADVIPEKYPLVRPFMWFFPDGNRERGIRLLERVAREGRFVRIEAAWFLVQIHAFYEPNGAEAVYWTDFLVSRYPENPLFLMLRGRVAFRWADWEGARDMFSRLVAMGHAARADAPDSERVPAPLLTIAHYYLGRLAIREADWQAAAAEFERAVQAESAYDHVSYFREQAAIRLERVRQRQGEHEEANKEANKEANENTP